jgi:hypothetical protein
MRDAGFFYLGQRYPVGRVALAAEFPQGSLELTVDDLTMTAADQPYLSVKSLKATAPSLPKRKSTPAPVMAEPARFRFAARNSSSSAGPTAATAAAVAT